jgi:hypothetical protein
MLRPALTAQAIDDILAGSFPASDPPGWTSGIARLAPLTSGNAGASTAAPDDTTVVAAQDADDARPTQSDRTLAQGLVSLAGATAIALLVPVAILAVGTPVVLALRGAAEAVGWLLAMVR